MQIITFISIISFACAATVPNAYIGQDASGDLHVNTTGGSTIFVNGVNFTSLVEEVATLKVMPTIMV